MPVCERDPWRLQFFEGIACPDGVNIPTDDPDAWEWYPGHRWVYDKLKVAESQGLSCGPHGVPPKSYPMFSKPIINLKGMGVGSRPLFGPGDYEIEFTEAVVGNSSPVESELADAIRDWVTETDPGAELAPMAMPGFSDSRWFREAFDGATVYGFWPHREIGLLEAAPLIHGADERVPASDIELSARFFSEMARRLLA